MPGGAEVGYGALTKLIDSASDTLWMIPQGFINNWITGEQYKERLGQNVEASKELINYQNAYNTPQQQMQRLLAAGLNPNLVYGSAAPAGQSGTAQASASAEGFHGYNTASVAQSALAMAQMKQSDAATHQLEAAARLQNAEAATKEMYNTQYPVLLSIQVQQAQKNLEKTAADIQVSQADAAFKIAQQHLAEADRLLREGQIDLLQYQKQNLIAQTYLYISDAKLKQAQEGYFGALEYNTRIEGAILEIQREYEAIMKNPSMAESERTYQIYLLRNQAKKSAAEIGIEGSKFIKWFDFVLESARKSIGLVKSVNPLKPSN